MTPTATVEPLPPPQPPPKPAYEPPLEVPLADLLKEYKANELRADGQFKGKLIRVSGTVGQVGKGPTGGAFVTVGTGARLELPMVQCFLADPTDPLATALDAGGKATLQGRVEGLLGHVLVKDCEVNPVMHLCLRLKEATGGQKCVANDPTSSTLGILFEQTDVGPFGVLDCVGTIPEPDRYEATEKYQNLVAASIKRGNTVVGSQRTLCFSELFGPAKGKTKKREPFPGELRAKVAAFFAGL